MTATPDGDQGQFHFSMVGEEGMFMVHQTIGSVLCCKCGVQMAPSAANMCVNCLRSEVDITEHLQKRVSITHCPDCDKYLQPPRTWITAPLESNELLRFCVKRVKIFNGLKLAGVGFIWTEPHSKRIKVKLKVRKEVVHGAILEQDHVVEYAVQDQMCHSCSRVQANPDQWVAVVQVRQNVSHRRTFFYLEQLILKHDAAARAVKMKQVDRGIDFFFDNRSHALKFVDFLDKVAPTKSRHDKQLVSHDPKSNNYNYKYTFSVELSPVCREDLICLPPRVALSLGNFGPLVICTKVSNRIALLDPLTLKDCFLDADQYWRTCFKPLLSSPQLVEYLVFNVEPVSCEKVNSDGLKFVLADADVARLTHIGKIFSVRTHLGHLLKPGDRALGYDLYGANNNDSELDKYRRLVLPDAILIKKSYEEKRRRKHRPWRLKSLDMEVGDSRGRFEQERRDSEYEQFLRDLEENPDLRLKISLYKEEEYQPSEMASVADEEEEGAPSVPLEELLADLDLSEEESGTDSMVE